MIANKAPNDVEDINYSSHRTTSFMNEHISISFFLKSVFAVINYLFLKIMYIPFNKFTIEKIRRNQLL